MNFYVVPLNSPLCDGVRVRSDSPSSAISRYLSYYPASDLVLFDSGSSATPTYNFYSNLRFVSFYSIKNLKNLIV